MKLIHELLLRAVNSPLRRKILEALNEGNATIEELEAKTKMKLHLSGILDTIDSLPERT